MSMTSKETELTGVHETAKSLAESLRQYIEAQYHIRNEGLVRERHALLRKDTTIAQVPYVEATPVYKTGDTYANLPIPKPAIDALTQLADMGVGLYPKPYEHQSQALTSFLGQEAADLVVATGTGSGKTESFLMPVIGKLAIEGVERPESAARPGCRAMLLYPMNALVNDQLARIRRLLGNSEAAKVLSKGRLRPIHFGSYTGRTPYPGQRSAKRDEQFIKPLFEEFYRKVAERPVVKGELERIGRWPSKDLDAFYGLESAQTKTYSSGKKIGQQHIANNWRYRLKTQPGDRELMTRHEMQQECPELLITNYSMLEYMLMRPIERRIFEQTRDWLKSDSRNEFILVLDEAHMYRGAGGAEVALLIRRLCARLEIPRERMRCILTSASLGTVEDGERFARDLTGLSETSHRAFRVIQGTQEPRPAARSATREEAEALANFDLTAFQDAANDLESAREALTILATRLGWNPLPPVDHDSLRNWLFENLTGFGPLEALITTVSGKAVKLDALSEKLFTGSHPDTARRATDTLLALGSYARRHSDGRVLIPTRLHLFHRGLPGLYACVDPECTERLNSHSGPTILGRLHTKPLDQCGCTSKGRVYELLTHRDCGAAFIRGYVNLDMNFVWHQPSGPLSEGETIELTPIEILVEENVHPRSRHRDKWLHISTGSLSSVCPADASGYRKVRVPDMAPGKDGITFDNCPVCMRKTRKTKEDPSKIMDHVTKGEAPFATLVRTQMARQPASRPVDVKHPNGGRKVLIFSDGRQKAARLARDIPRDIELDVFRQAIAVACARLTEIGLEPKPNQNLYLAFLSVLSDHDLPIFDGQDASKISAARIEYERDCESDLTQALGDGFVPLDPPARYRIALLKLLCGNYYSLSGTTVGFVEPTQPKFKRLRVDLKAAGVMLDEKEVRALAVAWIDSLLGDFAFDESIDHTLRRKAAGYFRPDGGGKGLFDSALRETLINLPDWGKKTVEAIEAVFRSQLASETEVGWFLSPNSLRLRVDLSHIWAQCPECTALMPFAFREKTCLACGSEGTIQVDPTTSDYVVARKGFWRMPVQEALVPEARISNLSVEEHTAQLSNRDRSSVHATTELYELRFQDVLIDAADRPIDILSCTTTMEVGVDIGSLVAVALRNVPPQRENYQQRAGRAGRRGASVSTVVTYSQNGPHDSHYYLNPEEIVAGPPRTPEVKVDNEKIARRHVHAYLIQTFFHELMEQGVHGSGETTSRLEKSLGSTREFFHGAQTTGLNLENFKNWVDRRVLIENGDLRTSVVAWLPSSLDTAGRPLEQWLTDVAQVFLADLLRLGADVPAPVTSNENEESDDPEISENAGQKLEQEDLLEFLFFHSFLPSYAFPTSLCSFLVEKYEKNIKGIREVRTVQRPQQSISQALSEYAPGRLIVIDKKKYRSGGVFADLPAGEVNRARPLFANPKRLIHCAACSFIRNPHNTQGGDSVCPVCGGNLIEEIMIEPEVFGPEDAKELPDDDNEQEITFATMAQFPQPVDPEVFTFRSCGPNASFTHATDRRLVTVNRGKDSSSAGGFLVCGECGAASVYDEYSPGKGAHKRPYRHIGPPGTPELCSGAFKHVLLGHDFSTDLLLLRLRIVAPLVTDTSNAIALRMLEDALHTIAEALRLAASRHKQLDLDPAEFGSGFRIVPELQNEARMLDVFLYDTLSGGAGYAEVAARNLPEILEATLALLEECTCDTSCTECLNHFHNQHIQGRLDRKLGAALLRYAVHGQEPQCASPEDQATTLSQLCSSLELDGFHCIKSEVPEAPILVESGGHRIALGSFPGLIGRPEFVHKVKDASHVNGSLALNEYLLRANVPDAHQQIRAMFR
ncbi:DEAD/DEAH box helicase [Paludibacterium sp. B53371]|uniref:DEAD/DEAH box helicase n=1 Tax=Paludibacterium sp. B53371 TaxID=2806263 RepID=UPI001C0533EB|nr:DEAD/DEAH box helicase [Paludibacterium sp. B53371]